MFEQDRSPGKVPILNFNNLPEGTIEQSEQPNKLDQGVDYGHESDQLHEEAMYPASSIEQEQTKKKVPGFSLPKGALGAPGGLGLNLAAMGDKKDYQDEFMAKVDEFSESWRQQLRKEKRF
jgi:hypothetical protein